LASSLFQLSLLFMASLKGLNKKVKRRSGITLIEILIASTIAFILLGTGLPVAWEFFQKNELITEKNQINIFLKTARTRAMSNINQSAEGVYFTTSDITIFQGGSYATRNNSKDQTFPRSKIVNHAGAIEIKFQPLSGQTASTSITLSNPQGQIVLNINSEGRIQ